MRKTTDLRAADPARRHPSCPTRVIPAKAGISRGSRSFLTPRACPLAMKDFACLMKRSIRTSPLFDPFVTASPV